MIQLNLSKQRAEELLVQHPEWAELRDSYEEALRHGFVSPQELKFFLSDTNACGVVRSDEVAGAVNKYARPHRADCKALTTPSDLSVMTCAIMQRQRSPGLTSFIERIRKEGHKVFYDLDDDLFSVPEEFTHVYDTYSQPEVQESIRAIMRACDGVTVASEVLGTRVKEELGDDTPVIYIPNAIDLGTWYPSNPTVESPAIIGWMASGTHTYDCSLLDEVMPLVVEALGYRNVLVEIIGNVSNKAVEKWGVPYRQLPWTPYHKLPAIMSRWTCGMAPVQRNTFNDCKSSIKALQYWGLEKPIVVSSSPVYDGVVEHGINGFSVESAVEWAEALVTLVKDVDLRLKMGHNGYNTVVENYDLKDRVWDWISLGSR